MVVTRNGRSIRRYFSRFWVEMFELILRRWLVQPRQRLGYWHDRVEVPLLLLAFSLLFQCQAFDEVDIFFFAQEISFVDHKWPWNILGRSWTFFWLGLWFLSYFLLLGVLFDCMSFARLQTGYSWNRAGFQIPCRLVCRNTLKTCVSFPYRQVFGLQVEMREAVENFPHLFDLIEKSRWVNHGQRRQTLRIRQARESSGAYSLLFHAWWSTARWEMSQLGWSLDEGVTKGDSIDADVANRQRVGARGQHRMRACS